MDDLSVALQGELTRCRELKEEYDKLPYGVFGSITIGNTILTAERAIGKGDILEMIKCYRALEGCE